MSGKKSQISVFLILGVVLVAALVVYIGVTELGGKGLDAEIENVQRVPREYQPLQDFVTACLKATLRQGLELAGEHGGYVWPERFGIKTNPNNPTEAEGVELFPGTGIIVPYWHYMSSKNDCYECDFGSKMPPLHSSGQSAFDISIESQLSTYIEENIPSCVSNFSALKKEAKPLKKPKAVVKVRDQGVLAYLEYPFSVSSGKESFELKNYRYEEPLPLKSIYEFAKEITENEAKHKFFERQTLNLITMASQPGINPNRMPPMTGTELKCGPGVTWVKTNVRENIFKPLLATYLPFMFVYGTRNMMPPRMDDDIRQSIYYQMIMPLNFSDAKNYAVMFNYLNWPVYFQIWPARGDMLSASSRQKIPLLGFCMNSYEFSYDISYPVLAELQYPDYDNGKGYSFMFALEANIRNNEAVNKTTYKFANTTETQAELLACNPEQRLSGEVLVNVTDSVFRSGIPGVVVSFCYPDADGSCSRDVCTLGETGEKGVWKGRMPTGVGILLLSGPDVLNRKLAFGISYNQSRKISVEVPKIVEVNVSIKKRMMRKELVGYLGGKPIYQWKYNPSDTDELSEDEKAMITLERVSDYEDDFTAFASIRGNETKTMRLIPGTYKLSVMLMSEEKIEIPIEQECYKPVGGVLGLFFKRKCVELPGLTMEQSIVGGAVVDEGNGYITITPEKLRNTKKITFYAVALSPGDINTHKDLEKLNAYERVSRTKTLSVLPEFS